METKETGYFYCECYTGDNADYYCYWVLIFTCQQVYHHHQVRDGSYPLITLITSLKTKLTGHLIISQSRILLFPSSCKFQNQKIFNVQILQAAGFREKMVEPFIGLGFLPLNWMISEGCQSTVKSCLCSAAKGQLLYLRRGEEVGSIIERKAEALSRDFTSRTFQKR